MNLPLPTGEVDFVSERSEFTKSGEGTIVKMLNAAKNKCAFTLSEVLIVLAVLGVVAAMTIPDLVQDYQKKATATQVKKAYSTLNQVVTASAADNGPMSDFFAAHPTLDADTVKEYFDTYWLPYFRVQKVAVNNGTLYGKVTKPYVYLSGAQYAAWVATSYAGERILFSDVSGMIYFIMIDTNNQTICVDINGTKEPNTLGKDVFIFEVALNDNVVNPHGYKRGSNCLRSSYGATCAEKIKRDGWEIADDYPW